MDLRVLKSGFGSAILALIVGGVLGTYGGWSAVLQLSSAQFGSWIIAVVLSVALAYIYSSWFNSFLPGTPTARGAIYGVLVWVLMLILGGVSVFFKEATYPEARAGQVIFLTLILHVVWGASLGLLHESR
ncbi:MAG: hypothetical protein WD231_01440 [Candidatus Woykebacteria bacterium]